MGLLATHGGRWQDPVAGTSKMDSLTDLVNLQPKGTSTVKVPTLGGRIAWVACIVIAVFSLWLLNAPQVGEAGSKLGIAGAAAVLGLVRLYRSSLVDAPWPADAELGRSKARLRMILNGARWTAIVLAIIALGGFVFELNYRGAAFTQPVVLALGGTGFGLVCVREALSASLASDWFQPRS